MKSFTLTNTNRTNCVITINGGNETRKDFSGADLSVLKEKEDEIAVLRARNDYLEQFAPHDDYGKPGQNGKPRILLRRGYYTSRNGRRPKILNPAGENDFQPDLFNW